MNEQLPAASPGNQAASAPTAPPVRHALLRWRLIILLIILIVAALVTVPLVVQPWLRHRIDAVLAGRGLALSSDSQLSLSIFGARMAGHGLRVLDITQPQQPVVATATDVVADLALRDSLASGDLVLNQLTVNGVTGSLRRRSDGHTPLDPANAPAGKPLDWQSYYQKLIDQYQSYQQKKQAQRQTTSTSASTPAKPNQPAAPTHAAAGDPGWDSAVRYRPLVAHGRTVPRLLIHHLAIAGAGVALPDPSALDITAFTITGSDVTTVQDPGETMQLDGQLTTQSAGAMTLALTRNAAAAPTDANPAPGPDQGHFVLQVQQLPLALLNDPQVVGEDYAHYGASGTAQVALTLRTSGWDLTGSVDSLITDLALKPDAQAGSQAEQVARYVDQLHGKPIHWPITLGGTLLRPTITDSGVKAVLTGSALDAVKNAIGDQATEKARAALDEQEKKNPQIKQAENSLKGLFQPKK